MKRLAEEFGPEWAMQHIIPQVYLNACNDNLVYLLFITTSIKSPEVLRFFFWGVKKGDLLSKHFVPEILRPWLIT